MTGKIFQPQMTQMNADVFLKFLICGNLRNLRLNHSSARETDRVLKEILERSGV